MKPKSLIILDIILILVIVSSAYFIFKQSSSDGQKCLNNPLVYGVNQISNSNRLNLECGCSFIGSLGTGFQVTKEGISNFNDKINISG